MLPVVTHLVALEQPDMAGDACLIRINIDTRRVEPDADFKVGQVARHRVAVALHGDEAGAGDAGQHFDVAVEDTRHRHQVRLLQFQRIKQGQPRAVRVRQLRPQLPAAGFQPGVEFIEAAET